MTDEQPTKPPERFTPPNGLREMVSVTLIDTFGKEHPIMLPGYPRIGDDVMLEGNARTVTHVTWRTDGVVVWVE